MKYLKSFENVSTDFKVGDIVVCSVDGVYYEQYHKFKVGDMFEILRLLQYPYGQTIKLKDLDGDIYPGYHDGNYFISLDDWNISKDANKYNL